MGSEYVCRLRVVALCANERNALDWCVLTERARIRVGYVVWLLEIVRVARETGP